MDAKATVIAAALTLVGTLVIGYFTKKSAKENTVITGYTSLTKDLQSEVARLAGRVETLEHNEDERRRLARRHDAWDWWLVKFARSLTNEPIPDPPPLDVWE